jgi:AcrR family transcriptional regulator
VLDATLALLEKTPVEALTLNQLARNLGVTTMSLYTYFPNRDALLDAAAEWVFSRFEWPAPQATWQDQLIAWMRALSRHFERYPIAWKVVRWDDHISPAWVRVFAPAIKIIYNQGLRGQPLAQTVAWFIEAAIGFIGANANSHKPGFIAPAIDMRDLDPEGAPALFEYWGHVTSIDRESVLEIGFIRIAEGVEATIDEVKKAMR